MKLYDPTVQTAARQAVRAPKLEIVAGLTIGLLTNGKVNADVLLRETAALFENRDGCTVLEMVTKNNASAPAVGTVIETLAERCDFMLTATGD